MFWIMDSLIHYLIYGENEFQVFPPDINELWMRGIIFILIILFGLFADYHSNKILRKEKELEALHIYNSTLFATHHILNNLLNQMLLFVMEAKKCSNFNREVIEEVEIAIGEASGLINKLSNVQVISEENIKVAIKPEETVIMEKLKNETNLSWGKN